MRNGTPGTWKGGRRYVGRKRREFIRRDCPRLESGGIVGSRVADEDEDVEIERGTKAKGADDDEGNDISEKTRGASEKIE